MSAEPLSLPAWLVDCTLQGSIAILLVVALVPLVRRFLGARAAYLLWVIVLLRLLVPWLPTTPLHWGTPSVRAEAAPRALLMPGMKVTATTGPARVPAPAAAVAVAKNPAAGSAAETKPPAPRWSWSAMAMIVWLVGMLTVLGLALFCGIRADRLVRRAREIPDDALRDGGLVLPGTSRVCIRETGELRSPALTGVLRPTILLPLDWRRKLSAIQLQCVLAHELGHFHRGDLIWRWAFLVARAVHWFNPLVWLAERLARTDQEMACDEWVLRRDRPADARAYGEAILASAQRLPVPGLAGPIQAGMAESRAGLRRRMRHLREIRSHGWRARMAGLLLAATLLVLTGPARSGASAAAAAADKPTDTEPMRPAPHYDITVKMGPVPAPTPRPTPFKPATQVQIESKFVELPSEMAAELLSAAASGNKAMGIRAVYDDKQYQTLLRRLDQKKGVDLMSAPRVTTKSGIRCVINVIREFRYPTEFEQSPDGKGPVTPAAFGKRDLGVAVDVTPTLTASGDIDLILAPEVVDFGGFVNFGGSRLAKKNLEGDALKDKYEPSAAGAINQPIFSTRRIYTTITLRDGETAVLGGVTRDDVQAVEDTATGKRLPDIHVMRSLFIFVTVKSINQGGQPIHPGNASAPRSAPPASMPVAPVKADDMFYGVVVRGKPGFVTSPYAPGAGYVDVRGFPANTEVKDPYTGQIFLVPSPDGANPAEPLPDPNTPLGKALRIMIPSVEFKDADLREVMDALKKRGDELDSESASANRGVNLVLKLPAQPPAPRKITAKLTNISLFEALRFAAATNDLVVVGEPYALSIQPVAIAAMITRTYQVPPPFLPGLQATKPSDMKSFWRAHGIDFAPGASVNFRAPAELVIRNSRNEHEKLQKLFSPAPAVPEAR